jgi:hypothetical protein
VWKNNQNIIKSMALCLFAVAGMAFLTASSVRAGEQDFTLNNKTGVEIHKLQIAPHSSDEWGEDILGKDTLADGDSLDITFGKHETAVHWDLRIEDEKGNSLEWESLDLLTISEVTLHYKDGKAWADVK